jgi:hydrogenase nickel incorporation protein HypA/HybF
MHELSVALGIIDVAAEEAGRQAGRVAAVHLRLGPLSGVVRSALVSAYELAREGTALADADLVVEDVALTVYCPACDGVREPAAPWALCCPDCGAPTPDVVSGRELEVTALEMIDP